MKIYQQNGNVSWRGRAQIKQLAWAMVEMQIGHLKSRLVFSARFPVINWRSCPGDKSGSERSFLCHSPNYVKRSVSEKLKVRWTYGEATSELFKEF